MKLKNRLRKIHDGPENVVTVFVHGFRAVCSSAELDQLTHYILRARPRGRVYLLHWQSGNWRATVGSSVMSAAVRAIPTGGFGAPALAAMAVAAAGVSAVDFRQKRAAAEKLGTNLKRHLSKIPGIHDTPVDLIGHSLGARVLHYALAENDWSDYCLRDVILLGGAADRNDGDWVECASEISGAIHNVYLPHDATLMAAVLEASCGTAPIPERSRKIFNHKWAGLESWAGNTITSTVSGHTYYWRELADVLEQGWPRYSPARKPLFYLESSCPITDDVFHIPPDDGLYECPECSEDVEVVYPRVRHS